MSKIQFLLSGENERCLTVGEEVVKSGNFLGVSKSVIFLLLRCHNDYIIIIAVICDDLRWMWDTYYYISYYYDELIVGRTVSFSMPPAIDNSRTLTHGANLKYEYI